ncbi:MAG: hypothetical protein O7G83_03780 [Proteobacteria bacterium]|nr:hypothetical protein [Pseudomonadota bacterium]
MGVLIGNISAKRMAFFTAIKTDEKITLAIYDFENREKQLVLDIPGHIQNPVSISTLNHVDQAWHGANQVGLLEQVETLCLDKGVHHGFCSSE